MKSGFKGSTLGLGIILTCFLFILILAYNDYETQIININYYNCASFCMTLTFVLCYKYSKPFLFTAVHIKNK